MPAFDVVGFGTAACDYLTQVDEYPGVDRKVRSTALAIEGGGTVGNALVTLARLGYRVAFAGSVGEDDFGRFILKGLEAEDIDASLAQVEPGARSPFAFCVASPPHRNVFSIAPTTPPRDLNPSTLASMLDTRFVHLDGSSEPTALQIAAEARRRGVGVSLDLQANGKRSEELLACADIAIVSASFARERYPGRPPIDAVAELYRDGMQLAGITLGADGCVARADAEPFAVAAEPIDVIDSTGAGDAFHGAVLAGMLAGHSPDKALRLGAHVAALCCRALGARASLPTRDEVGDWL